MSRKFKFKIIPASLLLVMLLTGSCQTSTMSQGDKDGFVQIFDGKSLEGWEGDPSYWKVENGSIVGEITPATILKNNTFLIWEGGQPSDFELKLDYQISPEGNSGVNYRSERLEELPYALKGYQADIDGKNRYTGQNYEERGRTTLAYRGQKTAINSQDNPTASLRDNIKNNAWNGLTVTESLGETDELRAQIKEQDWNEMHLVVKGNRLQHYVNGVLMSDVTDNDSVNRKMAGLLGVQVHVGPPMKVMYRNIRLKQL